MKSTDSDRELMLARLLERLAAQKNSGGPIAGDASCPEDLSKEEWRALQEAGEVTRLLAELAERDRSATQGNGNAATRDSVRPVHGGISHPGRWGRWILHGVAGRGGFATVYHATDPILNREVALKIPLESRLDTASAQERFQREARAAAVLTHPAIVPVYEAGVVEGTHFLSMAWIPGRSLHDWLKDKAEILPVREAVMAVARIAEAVAHAHDRGIIHRDIKTANILIDESDEESPWWMRLKLADFGLAKDLDNPSKPLTEDDAILGTPAYMAPEQIASQQTAGRSSDIWSLGILLYELLIGKSPFKRGNYVDTLRAVENEGIGSMRATRVGVPRDLEAVCKKCLEKRPEDRYPSAHELVADLNRWVHGESVQVRPLSRLVRGGRWARRNPVLAGSLALTLVSLSLGFLVASMAWYQAARDRDLADVARRESESASIMASQALAAERTALREMERELQRNRDKYEYLLDAFDQLNPAMGGNYHASAASVLRTARGQAEKRFGDDPLVLAEVHTGLARSFMGLGLAQESLESRERAFTLFEQHCGRTAPETLRALQLLANAQSKAKRHADSLVSRREHLSRLQELVPPEETPGPQILTQTGLLLLETGDIQGAEQVYRDLEELGLANEMEAERLSDLRIGLLKEQGLFDEAVQIARDEVAVRRSRLGIGHPDTLRSMGQLANILSAAGEREEALACCREAYELAVMHRGSDSFWGQSQAIYYASRLVDARRFDEAISVIDAALSAGESRYGLGHPIRLKLSRLKAKAVYRDGEPERAIRLISESRQRAVETLGEVHHETVETTLVLSRFQRQLGAFSESIDLTQALLPKVAEEYGANRILFGRVALANGRAHQWAGHDAQAISVFRQFLDSDPLPIEESSELRCEMMLELMASMIRSGRFEEARLEAARFLERLEEAERQKSRYWIVATGMQSLVLCELSDFSTAAECAKRVLAHPQLSSYWENLMLAVKGSEELSRPNVSPSTLARVTAVRYRLLDRLPRTPLSSMGYSRRVLALLAVDRVVREFEAEGNPDAASRAESILSELQRRYFQEPAVADRVF